MNITFLGAARTVTGSCYLVKTEKATFLIDCGMFQGRASLERANEAAFPFDLGTLDFVLLSHAHIDHSGRLPKLWLDGYRGPIHATKATTDLCGVMLPDSGHIQEMEAEWENRKRQRAGRAETVPLYTRQDAVETLKLFQPHKYDEFFQPMPGVRVRLRDAGHILGSSIVEMWVEEGGKETKAVFSGDLGYPGRPILRDPAVIDGADVLLLESTYGDRLHDSAGDKSDRLLRVINDTARRNGNIVIPAFAVGRTQELVYELNKHRENPAHAGEPFARIPVYIDSPLAVSATEIFRRNMDCFDEEAQRYIASGDNPLDFPNLRFTTDLADSKRLNEDRASKIIISASGMCDAGRIKHHLKHNLWRKESSILFVGYQAEGTLGRRLVDGAKHVKLFGEEIRVNAHVEVIEGFSGHADQNGLLQWLGQFGKKPLRVVLVHGEGSGLTGLAQAIKQRFGIEAEIPDAGSTLTIGQGVPEHVVATAPARDTATGKLAVLGLMDVLREEFNARYNAMKDELIMASGDEDVERVAQKVRKYGVYLNQYGGK